MTSNILKSKKFNSIIETKIEILKHKVSNTSGKERQENREKLLLTLGAKPRSKKNLNRAERNELKEAENIARSHAELFQKIDRISNRPVNLKTKAKIRNPDGSVSYVSKNKKRKLDLKKKSKNLNKSKKNAK